MSRTLITAPRQLSVANFYDNFQRANGSLGTLVSGQSWNAQSSWSISGDLAINNCTLGSNLDSNGSFPSNTSGWSTSGATITWNSANNVTVTNSGAAQGWAYQSMTVVVNTWYRWAFSGENGTTTPLMNIGTSVGDATYYTKSFSSAGSMAGRAGYFFATGTTVYLSLGPNSSASGATALFSSINFQAITTPNQLFATVATNFSDVSVSVGKNNAQASWDGVVLSLDVPSNPQNYVLGLINGGNDTYQLLKSVSGTISAVASGSIGSFYVAGRPVALTKVGTTYSLYYRSSLLTSQTILDSSIINNNNHGMFLADSQASFIDFRLGNAVRSLALGRSIVKGRTTA